jgi:hypothetical protein
MVDLLFSILEALLETGMPSPDRLEDQRKARFAASLVALATAAGILVSAWQTSNAKIVMVVAALAAVWIVLFSAVDIVKEPGRSRWWSISACLFGAATLTLASYMLFR